MNIVGLFSCVSSTLQQPCLCPSLSPFLFFLHKQHSCCPARQHISGDSLATMSALATASSMSRACSVSRSGCLDFAVPVAPVARPKLQRGCTRSNRLRVCASQQQPKGLVGGLKSSATKFLQVGVACPNAAVSAWLCSQLVRYKHMSLVRCPLRSFYLPVPHTCPCRGSCRQQHSPCSPCAVQHMGQAADLLAAFLSSCSDMTQSPLVLAPCWSRVIVWWPTSSLLGKR